MVIFFLTSSFHGHKNKSYLLSFIDSTSGEELIGYKSLDGHVIIPAKYLFTYTDTMHAMAIVLNQSATWVCINRNDSVILTPFIYDNGPDNVEEGLFRFVENNKIGFANLKGEKIIPAKYDFVDFFKQGIAEYTLGGQRVNDGENWYWAGGYESGYTNKFGQEFIRVTELKGNYRNAWTKSTNKHVLLNRQGRIVKTFSTMRHEPWIPIPSGTTPDVN